MGRGVIQEITEENKSSTWKDHLGHVKSLFSLYTFETGHVNCLIGGSQSQGIVGETLRARNQVYVVDDNEKLSHPCKKKRNANSKFNGQSNQKYKSLKCHL